MNKILRKFLPSFLLAAIIVIAGVFYDEMTASAQGNIQINAPMIEMVHCSVEDQEVQKTSPADNSLLPCCIERHDNSGTVLPAPLQERVKFVQSLMTQQIDHASNAIDQKIYPSSPSPPLEAESISSTVKIE